MFLKVWRDEYLTWNPSKYNNVRAINLATRLIWLPDIMLYNTWVFPILTFSSPSMWPQMITRSLAMTPKGTIYLILRRCQVQNNFSFLCPTERNYAPVWQLQWKTLGRVLRVDLGLPCFWNGTLPIGNDICVQDAREMSFHDVVIKRTLVHKFPLNVHFVNL